MNEKLQVAKFDGTDFSVWKAQMESVLIAKDCGEAILQIKTEAGAAPTPAEKNAYAKKDNMAQSCHWITNIVNLLYNIKPRKKYGKN